MKSSTGRIVWEALLEDTAHFPDSSSKIVVIDV
jgi:hypothetical protein